MTNTAFSPHENRPKAKARPNLIAIEGQDGAGKSTLIPLMPNLIHDSLSRYVYQSGDCNVICTSDWSPNGDPELATIVREHVTSMTYSPAEAMLGVFLCRLRLLSKSAPFLASPSNFLVFDRYISSTYACQCDDSPKKTFWASVLSYLLPDYLPGLTIYLDCTFEDSQSRKLKNEEVDPKTEKDFQARSDRFHESFYILSGVVSGVTACVNTHGRTADAVRDAVKEVIDLYIDSLYAQQETVRTEAFAKLKNMGY